MIAVDMRSPGLGLHPVVDMAGHDYFNQSFFENVRVPRANLIGELNRGWYAAMTTFDFERSGVAHVGHIRRFFDDLLAHARQAGLLADPRVAATFAEMRVEIEVAKWLVYRVATIFAAGAHPDHESPIAKLFVTEMLQRTYQQALAILGPAAQVMPESAKYAVLLGRPAIAALWGIGQTIGGGTSEIQRTVIATRGLGLPRG
jgi:alkylation response protein AidB-like acyl-CoA dehydrogenase